MPDHVRAVKARKSICAVYEAPTEKLILTGEPFDKWAHRITRMTLKANGPWIKDCWLQNYAVAAFGIRDANRVNLVFFLLFLDLG
jgi:hypothetical protein